MKDGWLYKMNQLYVTQSEDHLIFIKEAHYSLYGGHFGTTKTL